MARRCVVTGKGPLTGNRVSHSNRKTKKRSLPNLQSKRYWVPSEGRYVKLKVSVRGMRIIDKRGIDGVVAELRSRGLRF